MPEIQCMLNGLLLVFGLLLVQYEKLLCILVFKEFSSSCGLLGYNAACSEAKQAWIWFRSRWGDHLRISCTFTNTYYFCRYTMPRKCCGLRREMLCLHLWLL